MRLAGADGAVGGAGAGGAAEANARRRVRCSTEDILLIRFRSLYALFEIEERAIFPRGNMALS